MNLRSRNQLSSVENSVTSDAGRTNYAFGAEGIKQVQGNGRARNHSGEDRLKPNGPAYLGIGKPKGLQLVSGQHKLDVM